MGPHPVTQCHKPIIWDGKHSTHGHGHVGDGLSLGLPAKALGETPAARHVIQTFHIDAIRTFNSTEHGGNGVENQWNRVIFGYFLKDLWYSIKLSGKQENKSTQNNQIQMHNIFMYFFEVPTNKSRRKASPCLAPLPLPPAWRKRGWNAGAGNWGWTRFPLIFWCFNCQVGIIIF